MSTKKNRLLSVSRDNVARVLIEAGFVPESVDGSTAGFGVQEFKDRFSGEGRCYVYIYHEPSIDETRGLNAEQLTALCQPHQERYVESLSNRFTVSQKTFQRKSLPDLNLTIIEPLAE